MRATISKLHELTGIDRRRIKSLIEASGLRPVHQETRGNRVFADYDSTKALPIIYGCGDDLDLTAERARLASEQADKTAMENARLRGDLVSLGDVEKQWQNLILGFRASALALPKSAAPHLEGKSAKDIEQELNDAVYSMLEDLAGDLEAAGDA